MCRYCNGNPEPIDNLSNCPTDMYIEQDLFVKNGDFFLKIASKINLGVGGNFHILTSTKIDYCPFCGRKLEDTENV